MADIDLWHWAAYNVEHAGHKADRPSNRLQAVEWMAGVADNQRGPAQLIRLPLVEMIVEHRAAQRHVFDVLKLVSALAESGLAFHPDFKLQTYFSLLTPAEAEKALPASVEANVEAWTGQRAPPVDVQRLFESLVSANRETQENVVQDNKLSPGEMLRSEDVAALVAKLKTWVGDDSASAENQHLLLRGLSFLAPVVAPGDGKALWDLVKDSVDLHQDTDPKLRALWGDVRAALGCDPLFSPQAPYLMLERFKGHTAQDEPIPGFVRIPAGPFTMGSKDDSDNQPNAKALIDAPFYIHRTPVTVAQFDAFVEDGGYTDTRAWWDKQGLAWRNGAFNSKITDINFQQHLARRGPELRQLPMDWSAQLPFQSRPVTGVTWFEARAYARWLSAQLQSQIKQNSDLDRYQVLLPTELQWERAARATSPTESDQRNWPWGNKEKEAEQAANLANQVGQPSAVGVYPPSSIGLYDMGGNVWEWQDNLYRPLKDGLVRLPKDHELTNLEEWEKTDRPTLRGGSWFNNPELARCSFRYWNHPDGSGSNIGLRVVLSLPISGGSGS